MAIRSIEDAKLLQEYCRKLGREGVYKEIVEIGKIIVDSASSPQMVLRCAGKIRALCTGCKWDCYWDEKQEGGRQDMLWQAIEVLGKTNL